MKEDIFLMLCYNDLDIYADV